MEHKKDWIEDKKSFSVVAFFLNILQNLDNSEK